MILDVFVVLTGKSNFNTEANPQCVYTFEEIKILSGAYLFNGDKINFIGIIKA